MDKQTPKIFKVSGYLLDPTGRLNADKIRSKLAYGCGYPFHTQHLHVEQEKVKDLTEDHPLLHENCDLKDCEKYFHAHHPVVDGRVVRPGQVYRHFKGNMVKVLQVAQDSESPGQYFVVYGCGDSKAVWCRPYGMFLSEVDHKKYPNITQKYRFELVEE